MMMSNVYKCHCPRQQEQHHSERDIHRSWTQDGISPTPLIWALPTPHACRLPHMPPSVATDQVTNGMPSPPRYSRLAIKPRLRHARGSTGEATCRPGLVPGYV